MTRYTIPLLLGLLLGFLMFFFLPLILTAWLADLWQTITGTPHVCDAGADLSPAEEQHTCGDCGAELQIVRPGKYQCVSCTWAAKVIEDLTSDRSADA
jgi:hypothetical protein